MCFKSGVGLNTLSWSLRIENGENPGQIAVIGRIRFLSYRIFLVELLSQLNLCLVAVLAV
jgi:hypothetical protein